MPLVRFNVEVGRCNVENLLPLSYPSRLHSLFVIAVFRLWGVDLPIWLMDEL